MSTVHAPPCAVVLLCGGMGSRCAASPRPKPINDVQGVPMIRRVLDVVLRSLDQMAVVTQAGGSVRLRAYLERTYPAVRFTFVEVPYQTRGPAETALLGLRQLAYDGRRQVLLLDNDCIYEGLDFGALPAGSFLLCAPEVHGGPTHFSYVEVERGGGHRVVGITERRKAADEALVCMGGYGFADADTCMRCCQQAVMACPPNQEPYMSMVVQELLLLAGDAPVAAVVLPDAFTIGTPLDVRMNVARLAPSTDAAGAEAAVAASLLSVDAPQPVFRSMRDHTVHATSLLVVQKSGPRSTLEAEVAYYRAVARSPAARRMFPQLLRCSQEDDARWTLFLERVQGGARLSDVYAAGLLSPECVRAVVRQACSLHHDAILTDDASLGLAEADAAAIRRHYLDKLEARAAVAADYPFPDAQEVLVAVRRCANAFLESMQGAPLDPIIHGDLWFSNVLLASVPSSQPPSSQLPSSQLPSSGLPSSGLVFVDPRGRFDGVITTRGHRCYDWAKMYMSISGLDVALDHGREVDAAVRAGVEAAFWESLSAHGAVVDEAGRIRVRRLAAVLLHGTFFSFGTALAMPRRRLAWRILKTVLADTGCPSDF